MQTPNVYEFEEEDDDGFYDELRRQILQLTAEDDVDDNFVQARKQGPYNGPGSGVPQPRCYYNWPGNREPSGAAPGWMLNLWRTGNGTGVFIPQTVQSRTRNRSRRRNERGRRTCKMVEKTTN